MTTSVASRERRHPDTANDPELGLMALRSGALLLLGSAVATLFGLGTLVSYGLPVVSVVLACLLLARGRHVEYLHLLLFLWLFTAGLRRLVDWQVGYQELSPVLLAAPAASLVGVLFVSLRHSRLPGLLLAYVTTFAIALGYALVVGAMTNGVAAALASFAAWGPPFFIALYIVFLPRPAAELARHVADCSWVYLAVLGGYGVVQWVVAPAWDVAWMKAIYTTGFSFGTAEAFGIRVYSLLNSPYTLGGVLVVLLATQLTARPSPARLVATVLGITALALSGVRSAWIILALVVVALAVRGRIPPRIAVLGTGGIVAAIVLAPESFAETVGDRLDSFGAGRSDFSYSVRDQFYSTVLPRLLTDPVGAGFGSTGVGVRTGGAGADTTFQDVDSAYIDALRSFGPVFGFLVIVMTLALTGWLWWRLSGDEAPMAAWSSFLLAVPVLGLLGDTWGGAVGALTWMLISLCSRVVADRRHVGAGPDVPVPLEPDAARSVGARPHLALAAAGLVTVCVLALVVSDRVFAPAPPQAAVGPCQQLRRELAAFRPDQPLTTGSETAVILGDSYTQGLYLPDARSQNWAADLGRSMQWTTYADAAGGTGFVFPGACGDGQYAARVDTVLDRRPDVVVVQGGLNDVGTDPVVVQRAAADLLGRLSSAPRVIVIGPPAAPSSPRTPDIDAALEAATTDARREYVSTQRYTLPFLADGIHLTVEGHAILARDVEERLRRDRG